MNESKFKHEVRRIWLPEYWSERIESKNDEGWPDVMFMSPTVTLVEFKWIPKTNKNGTFSISWRKTQPLFLFEYRKAGGNCGVLLRVEDKDLWVSVEASLEWLRTVQSSIDMNCRYLFPVSAANIKEFIK